MTSLKQGRLRVAKVSESGKSGHSGAPNCATALPRSLPRNRALGSEASLSLGKSLPRAQAAQSCLSSSESSRRSENGGWTRTDERLDSGRSEWLLITLEEEYLRDAAGSPAARPTPPRFLACQKKDHLGTTFAHLCAKYGFLAICRRSVRKVAILAILVILVVSRFWRFW